MKCRVQHMKHLKVFPTGKLNGYMRNLVTPGLDFVRIHNHFIYKEDIFAKCYFHPQFSLEFIDFDAFVSWSLNSNGPLNTSYTSR